MLLSGRIGIIFSYPIRAAISAGEEGGELGGVV